MMESTARAERLDAPAPFYVWEVPQKPVVVHVGLDAVERLEREVVESFRSVNSRGSEIGGILLGTVVPGARPVVVIEDYEVIPCEYARGPLYRLSEKDKAAFDAAIKRIAAAGKTSIVGMFRSNTRKGLSLDADDIAFFTARFGDPEKVMLLVRPFATKASVAGLFLWESGAIHAESSALEFPFSRAELLKRELTQGPVQRREKPVEPPAAPPAPEKQPVRAQVVPMPRREPPPAPPVAEPAAEPEPEPAPVPPEVAAPSFGATAEPKPSRGFKWIWVLAGAGVLAIATILFFYPGLLLRRGAPPQTVATEAGSLSLRVERASGQLVLTWNRDADSVKRATKAVLSISDGERKENVDLDLAQLRNGSVVYAPLTADVSFRLEVFGDQAGKSQSEYVRVLGSGNSPLDTNAAAKQEPQAAPAAHAVPAADTPEPAEVAEPQPVPSTPRRQFVPTLASRLSPAAPADMPEPPKLQAGGAPAGFAGLHTPQPNVAPPPAPPQRAAAPPAEKPRVGGQVQEAKLVSSKQPAYPPLARQARVQGTVQLEALIGKDGTVRDVKVLSGHPMLGPAAVAAVKQWIYRPSMLNGQPTEATTRVQVAFALDK